MEADKLKHVGQTWRGEIEADKLQHVGQTLRGGNRGRQAKACRTDLGRGKWRPTS